MRACKDDMVPHYSVFVLLQIREINTVRFKASRVCCTEKGVALDIKRPSGPHTSISDIKLNCARYFGRAFTSVLNKQYRPLRPGLHLSFQLDLICRHVSVYLQTFCSVNSEILSGRGKKASRASFSTVARSPYASLVCIMV